MTNSTEAKSSVTFSLNTPKGFPVLFTVRSESESELLDTIEKLEQVLSVRGYSAQQRTFGAPKVKQYIEGIKCPTCGNPVVKFVTKLGKTGVQCSTRKYDYVSKTTQGCAYIKWDEPATQENIL